MSNVQQLVAGRQATRTISAEGEGGACRVRERRLQGVCLFAFAIVKSSPTSFLTSFHSPMVTYHYDYTYQVLSFFLYLLKLLCKNFLKHAKFEFETRRDYCNSNQKYFVRLL